MTKQSTMRFVGRWLAQRDRQEPLKQGETWCTRRRDLFQTAEKRALTPGELARVRSLCKSCPIFTACLSEALVGPDVSGVVAGTTRGERRRLRKALQLTQRTVDVSAFAVQELSRGTPVDYSQLAAVVEANPGASLDTLAKLANCSTSTVKRYRRMLRAQAGAPEGCAPSADQVRPDAPDEDALLEAYTEHIERFPAAPVVHQDAMVFVSKSQHAVTNPDTATHRSGYRRHTLSRKPSAGQEEVALALEDVKEAS